MSLDNRFTNIVGNFGNNGKRPRRRNYGQNSDELSRPYLFLSENNMTVATASIIEKELVKGHKFQVAQKCSELNPGDFDRKMREYNYIPFSNYNPNSKVNNTVEYIFSK